MNMRTRLKRGAIGAMLALLVFSAGAFADTSTVPVTVGVVNGTRTLQVTAANASGDAPGTGPAALSFNETATTAPFGVVVSDITYSRTGYDVDAALSDLYLIDPTDTTDGFECTDDPSSKIESSAFTLGYDGSPVDLSGFEAVVEAPLSFAGDVSGLTGLSGTLEVTLDALYQSVSVNPAVVGLMDVSDEDTGAFANGAAHSVCGNADTNPTSHTLQSGEPDSTLDLSTVADTIWDNALTNGDANGDGSLTPAEAIDAGLLETGAASTDGRLYQEVASTLEALYPLLTITESLVNSVIATLEMTGAPALDAAADLVGQTGVYGNVPALTFDPAAASNASTGLYQGTMTVTLTDR